MREPHPEYVLLFGGPAAGKGTQARLLSQALGLPHVSSGDLLRERQTQMVSTVMQRGDLLPDDEVAELVFARLQQPDAAAGAVLDGFPRNLTQALALDRWLREHGGTVRAAVYLDVPDDEMVRRLIERGEVSGRSDDRAQTAPRRLEVFMRDMPPVLDHYATQGLLRTVNGAESVEDVRQKIKGALNARPVS